MRLKSPPYAGHALLLALVVAALDQLSKYAVLHQLDLARAGSIELLPFLSFSLAYNTGTAMSLVDANSSAGRWGLVALAAAISGLILYFICRTRRLAEALALGAILGSALGNGWDRARLGHVTDFVDVHAGGWHFYIFNVADSAISLGVLTLLVLGLRKTEAPAAPER